MARQRVAGIKATDHTYARGDVDGVRPGALVGVTVRQPRVAPVVVGPSRVDLEQGEVAEWQVTTPGGGWIDGVSWPTVEQAVAFARDPERLRTLAEWARVRDEAWLAHRHAAELDRRAAALLAAIERGTQ